VAPRVSALGAAQVQNRYLFNFAASYSTGGYKRLYEYARWFDQHGGAWFVIHPRCAQLAAEFPGNHYFVAAQSRIERLYDDCGYLRAIGQQIGQPQLYYSYGIPLYFRFGVVSWFHLSNVLPLGPKAIPLGVLARLKFGYLGMKIRAGFAHADVISAESEASLQMLGLPATQRLFLSVNGSDDELAWLGSGEVTPRQDIAVVVGTARYKALEDSYRLFEHLRRSNARLQLLIFGYPNWVPRRLRDQPNVVLHGLTERSIVIDWLRRSRIYISTTRIENSYNAAAEGMFFAEESYISDIGPHRELLRDMPFEQLSVSGVRMPLLYVQRARLSGTNLKDWNTVVIEMIARLQAALREQGCH
jgi:hypothetical protein